MSFVAGLSGKIRATREGLLQLQRRLETIREVCALLKAKCRALAFLIQQYMEESEKIREKLAKKLQEVYGGLTEAYRTVSSMEVESQAISVKKDFGIELKEATILDVDVPEIPSFKTPRPDLLGKVAQVASGVGGLLDDLMKVSELEAKIERLSLELGELHQRVNTIERVVIPEYEKAIKIIEGLLAEEALEELMVTDLRFRPT